MYSLFSGVIDTCKAFCCCCCVWYALLFFFVLFVYLLACFVLSTNLSRSGVSSNQKETIVSTIQRGNYFNNLYHRMRFKRLKSSVHNDIERINRNEKIKKTLHKQHVRQQSTMSVSSPPCPSVVRHVRH